LRRTCWLPTNARPGVHRLLAAVLRVEAGDEGIQVVTVLGVAESLDHLGRHATSRSRHPAG
jgi:hypothetical protein